MKLLETERENLIIIVTVMHPDNREQKELALNTCQTRFSTNLSPLNKPTNELTHISTHLTDEKKNEKHKTKRQYTLLTTYCINFV